MAVAHDHAPLVASAVQAEPVVVHVPVEVSVSEVEVAAATDNCTLAPAGAEPENVNAVVDVALSELDVPLSDAVARSGVDTAGSA